VQIFLKNIWAEKKTFAAFSESSMSDNQGKKVFINPFNLSISKKLVLNSLKLY